jgi:hypothetical protein
MFVEYNELPNNSRIWVYQSDREFTQEEVDYISSQSKEFIQQWTRHGSDLKGSFTIKYNQFLVLAVDQGFNNVSGCSIDASVHFVQALEQKLNVDMMDKMNISFKVGDHINVLKMNAFKEFAKAKKINAETVVFNNMIATKQELEEQWEVPAEQSWHKRFLV